MHRRIVVAAMASVLSFSSVGALHAAPMPGFHHGSDNGSGKMISFSVRNDSKTTLVLKAGDKQFTIEPGKTTTMKLQEGSQLINVNGSEKQAAGSVLTTVQKQLQGNTLAVS